MVIIMASVFHDFDCRYNPNPRFWQSIDSRVQENLVKSTIFAGELRLRRANGIFKTRRCIVTSTHMYYLSKWSTPKYKANINWKTVEPFTECMENCTNYGFRLSGCYSEDFYTKTPKELDEWVEAFSKVSLVASYEDDIMIIKQLGKGNGTIVNLCQSTDDLAEYAIKTVNKHTLAEKPEMLQIIVNEITALRILNHPNIVKLYKVYETDSHIHMLLEYLPCGDLYKRLNDVKKFREEEALMLVKSLIETVDYLHSMNFVHRDIKLENIVMTSEGNSGFKLIDFGLACSCKNGLLQACGSPGCVAPEMLRGNLYGSKVDMFSIGVLLFTLLSGKGPFEGKTSKEVLEKNRKCEIVFGKIGFGRVSKNTMELLIMLLAANPTHRLTAKEALGNPCIKKLETSNNVQNNKSKDHDNSQHDLKVKQHTADYMKTTYVFTSGNSSTMKNNYII